MRIAWRSRFEIVRLLTMAMALVCIANTRALGTSWWVAGSGVDNNWSNASNWVGSPPGIWNSDSSKSTQWWDAGFGGYGDAGDTTITQDISGGVQINQLLVPGDTNHPLQTINGYNISIGNGGINMSEAAGNLTINNSVGLDTYNDNQHWNIAGGRTLALNGVVYDANIGGETGGAIYKEGSGRVFLGNNNTFNRSVYINAGAVIMGSSASLGSGAVSVAAGGQLQANSGDHTLDIANAITFNGQTSGGAFYAGDWGIVNTNFNGAITLNADTNFNLIYDDKHVTINGQITGSGKLIVEPTYDWTPLAKVTINGSATKQNSFGGVVVGTSGGLAPTEIAMRGDVNALGGVSATNTINRKGVLDIAIGESGDYSIGGNFVFNGGTLRSSNGNNHLTGQVTLTSNGGYLQAPTQSKNLYIDGQISGEGGLTINHAATPGTVYLTNAGNNYAGGTLVEQGSVLALTSTGALGSGDVTVNGTLDLTSKSTGFALGSGQSLKGSGIVALAANQALTVNGGLAPGNSPGTLTLDGDLVLGSSSVSNFQVNGWSSGAYDLVQQASSGKTVTFGGSLNVTFDSSVDLGWAKIFDFTNYAGSFAPDGFTYSGLTGGKTASFNAATGILTVVPEPSSLVLLTAGLLGLLAYAWRKRK